MPGPSVPTQRPAHHRLVVSNPGGLYGITVDRLGRDYVTSARNARLVDICQYVRSPSTGARVIEALATGIPAVTEALATQGLPPAHYVDNGIRFTVVLHQAQAQARPVLTHVEQRVLDAVNNGIETANDLAAELDVTAQYVRKILRGLRERGMITQQGGRGRRTVYHPTGRSGS
ncbi:ATP-binding protein [Frankia sp. CiP1_Cm_nod2]|uniref:ATP-binding protein n=1 Tax=Frankia sp. CiP1_Cm_nod2 TaxID=2897161 RepID=UPI002023C63A